MATLSDLCGAGVLMRTGVKLSRQEFEARRIYVTPEFFKWLNDDVKRAVQLDPSDLAPRHQAHDFLRAYQTGAEFHIGRTFKRMRPLERDVFEFTTPDLRVFGWFYRTDEFIAVKGDFMEHTHSKDGVYDSHRDDVVHFRETIDLDPPKYVPGALEHDVLSV